MRSSNSEGGEYSGSGEKWTKGRKLGFETGGCGYCGLDEIFESRGRKLGFKIWEGCVLCWSDIRNF